MLVAVAVGTSACSRVPDPFIYYPGLSYPEMEAIDPDSAHAMLQRHLDVEGTFHADDAHLQIVEPNTRKVVLDMDHAYVAVGSTLFETGDLLAYPAKDANPDSQRLQIKSMIQQLGQSGWKCDDGAVTNQSLDKRYTHEIKCLNVRGTPAALLDLRLSDVHWALNVLSRRSERCKRTPPRYQYECRGDLHDEF